MPGGNRPVTSPVDESRLAGLIGPVVAAAGMDLESVRASVAGRRRLLRVERAEGEGGGESGEAAEAGEETGADGHESSPYVETEALLQSYA